MQFMLLIYEDESIYGEDPNDPALMTIVGQHRALAQSLGKTLVSGSGLNTTHSATTVRTKNGKVKSVHDGPFAETKEQLGGYYIVDVPDLDAALAIAKRIPMLKDGSVEIRPLMHMAD